jgi:hypothetical protein
VDRHSILRKDEPWNCFVMSVEYTLVDIPTSLTPASFEKLVACSSAPATQPRNPPEPKKKDRQWPQAEDLKKLHAQYGGLAEKALEQAYDLGVKEWCAPRIEKDENDCQDVRQWHEMFKIMDKFGGSEDRAVIELSGGRTY